ncbi:MAG: hypothetical protein N4A33_05355 [Bacteriovoracaceae bacterium]|jgi:hypothetical protein|nr:hypothetical protein [Bacteriovoracaceae bacterium]
MKILILLILSTQIYAKYTFNKIQTVEGFALNFKLSHITSETSARLDCQSFFQKFDIKRKDQIVSENYITISECELLYTKIDTCLKKVKYVCFDTKDLYQTKCSCN